MTRRILPILLIALSLWSCHELPDYVDNPKGNFDALWSILDQRYCFFDQKDVDWDNVYARYSIRISDQMTAEELFGVCAEMVNELRDGHTNLAAPFNTSYYRKWWSDYPQNFNERLIEQYYFNFNYRMTGNIKYGILEQNVGYMLYPDFNTTIGEGNLDCILNYCATCDGLIIDIRDNGGGSMLNVETLVSRFITERTLVGYISHKTGPGHSDFSSPRPYYYNPAVGHTLWGKPVVVLTNRSTFSAANNFASVMKLLPNVTIVGATTGGGSGMPFSSELPCGWTIRFSACSVLDAMGNSTEQGIDPSPGCAIDLDPIAALQGTDTILQRAIELLTQ